MYSEIIIGSIRKFLKKYWVFKVFGNLYFVSMWLVFFFMKEREISEVNVILFDVFVI